jgi:beta-lactamase class C
MKLKCNILFGLVLLFMMALVVSCQSEEAKRKKERKEPPPVHPLMMQCAKKFDSFFKSEMPFSGSPGAAFVIVKDSTIIYVDYWGVREFGKSDPIDSNTVFRIGSVSKGFTAVLASILIDSGFFSWDDPVKKYITDFNLKDSAQASRILVKHLLSHSTGLPRHTFTDLLEDSLPMSEIKKKLGKVNLLAKEGQVFAYQNFTYSLIEEVILKATGRTYNDWMVKSIFQPGGLKTASLTGEEYCRNNNYARPHNMLDSNGFEVKQLNCKYYYTSSVGGVNASILDMAQWLKIILGNRQDIATNKELDYVFQPFINSGDDDYFGIGDTVSKVGYGMGWRVWENGNRRINFHSGYVNNFRSEIAIDRANKIGICVLFNSQNSLARMVTPKFFEYFDQIKDSLK